MNESNCGVFAALFPRGVQLGQVAIYCRVSTDDQSCARQERDLRAFARRAGHHIVTVFKETASGAKNDRVERKKVMAFAQAGEIDAIAGTSLAFADVATRLKGARARVVVLLDVCHAGVSDRLATNDEHRVATADGRFSAES
jgi:hypothetical protein